MFETGKCPLPPSSDWVISGRSNTANLVSNLGSHGAGGGVVLGRFLRASLRRWTNLIVRGRPRVCYATVASKLREIM